MRLDPGQIEVIDDQMAAVIRQKSGAERLAIANGLYVSARRTLTSHLRFEHPEWSDEQIAREVARRLSHGSS
jgi:hypothetical protein